MSSDGAIEELLEKVNNSIAELQAKGLEKREVKCQHYFGYLSKLSPDMTVPEECLLCQRVVECMLSE